MKKIIIKTKKPRYNFNGVIKNHLSFRFESPEDYIYIAEKASEANLSEGTLMKRLVKILREEDLLGIE